jgi:hypothetical protein
MKKSDEKKSKYPRVFYFYSVSWIFFFFLKKKIWNSFYAKQAGINFLSSMCECISIQQDKR